MGLCRTAPISPQASGVLKAWTKWFGRYLRSVGITDRRKVFHSFRHSFKDALRAADVSEDLNDALLGQKNSSVGRSYGAKQKSGAKDIVRRFGIERLKSAVYAVEYKGLVQGSSIISSQVSVKEKQRRR